MADPPSYINVNGIFITFTYLILAILSANGDWVVNEDSCYLFLDETRVNYETAQSNCDDLGASLAELNTMAEYHYVVDLIINSDNDVWVGLEKETDETAPFLWYLAQTEPLVDMWGSGEPNDLKTDHCSRLRRMSQSFFLATRLCSNTYYAICEKPKATGSDSPRYRLASSTGAIQTEFCSLMSRTSRSYIECAAACSTTVDCQAFVYDRNSGQDACRLYQQDSSCTLTIDEAERLFILENSTPC